MNANIRGVAFVAIQILTLLVLGLTGPVIAQRPELLALEIAAVALGAWAIWVMRNAGFAITPEVEPDSRLITHGPYRYIRHPMYASLMLLTLSLTLDTLTTVRMLITVVLWISLIVKLHYEEKLLVEHFKRYHEYQKNSKKLIPFVF